MTVRLCLENEIILTAVWKITELNLPPELQSCLFFYVTTHYVTTHLINITYWKLCMFLSICVSLMEGSTSSLHFEQEFPWICWFWLN